MIDPRLIEAEALQPDDWAVDVEFPWAFIALVAALTVLAVGAGVSRAAGWW